MYIPLKVAHNMKLKIVVSAVVVNSRVVGKGENKGETKHSVQFFGLSEDGIPAQFACYSPNSIAQAQALASRFPVGSHLDCRNIPREPYFVDESELTIELQKK